MKKILPLLILIFMASISFAQIRRTPARSKTDSSTHITTNTDGITNNRKQIFKELNLTPEQKLKIKELREQHKDAKDVIDNDSTLSNEQKNEKLKMLKKQQLAKIQDILTEEQKAKFREMKLLNKNNE